MSANRAKDTSPELILRRELWQLGLRGYRLHPRKIPGRPDIAYVSRKVALFVMGCFWHRCQKCDYKLPKTNREFWKQKFGRNVERDKRKQADLRRLGWKVFIVWECELKTDLDRVMKRIADYLN
jgi:DNA mismatch endonuclease (patch repair protein)